MAQRGWRFPAVLTSTVLALLPALAGAQVPAPPAARPPAREFHVIGRIGIDGGGDTVDQVVMTDGSTQKLSAGGLFTIAAGLVYTPVATPLVVEATIGFKVDDVTASNGKLQFDRWPLELLASYRIERHRIGGGLAYHLSPTYSCKVDGQCDFSSSADDALGAIVQYAYGDYTGGFVWDLGLRFTLITYQAPGGEFSGNSFGGFVSFGY